MSEEEVKGWIDPAEKTEENTISEENKEHPLTADEKVDIAKHDPTAAIIDSSSVKVPEPSDALDPVVTELY